MKIADIFYFKFNLFSYLISSMKKYILVIICCCVIVNVVNSQKHMNLETYSKDTIQLLTNVLFLGNGNEKYKHEMLNTYESDTINRNIGINISIDSMYLFSLKNLPFNRPWLGDGEYLNVFLYDSIINTLSNCRWIEFEKIELKKHCIYLYFIVRTKINSQIIKAIEYKFKVSTNKNYHETLNEFYAPKYKLIKKRSIKARRSSISLWSDRLRVRT